MSASIPQRVRSRLESRLWDTGIFGNRTLHLVGLSEPPKPSADDMTGFKVNDLGDLNRFEETERWHDRDAFLSLAEEQLSDGTNSITLVNNGVLAFIAWMAPETPKSTFGYIGQTLALPPETATEFSVYVHPGFRRRGLFLQGLQFLARYAFDHTPTRLIVGAVHGDNPAALNGHLQAGFEHVGSFAVRRFIGSATRSATAHADGYDLVQDDEPDCWRLIRDTRS